MSSYPQEHLFLIEDIEEHPPYGCYSDGIDQRLPGLRQDLVETSEEEIRGGPEVNYPSGQVNSYRIHSDYNEEESPSPEIPDINYKIEESKKQDAKAPDVAYKGARPEVLVNREIQIPYLPQ